MNNSSIQAPQGPCFISGQGGYFSYELDFRSQSHGSLYGILKGFFDDMVVFDAQGNKWTARGVASKYKKTWWWMLLASTVYNPRVTVTILWADPKPYHLSELKDIYVSAVNKDDDILTQFVEPALLKERIGQARTFTNLADVYGWMSTDHGRKEGS